MPFPARAVAITGLLLLSGCAAEGPRKPTPLEDVIRASRTDTPAQVIERLRASRTTYALRGSDFHRLSAAGVAPEVLDYLQTSYLQDLDLLMRYTMTGASLGGCDWCRPQPATLPAEGRP